MKGVLESQIVVLHDPDSHAGVELVPIPPDARRGELARSSKMIIEPAETQSRLNEGEEATRSDRRTDRPGQLDPPFDLEAVSLQSGKRLLNIVRHESDAPPLAMETGA